MKIYDFGNGNYFEVMEHVELETSSGIRLRTEKYISKDRPVFWFGDSQFFDVSYSAWTQKKEISDEEFKLIIDENIKHSWKEVFEIEKSSNGNSFTLTPYSVSTRAAYIKHNNKSRQDFMGVVHDLREEVLSE